MGRPIVPSLVVDGRIVPILHVSQIANVLGLPVPASRDASRLAVDTVDLLRAWIELVRGLLLQELRAPTPSRGRSLRNLTVNVVHPFELLPEAWATGVYRQLVAVLDDRGLAHPPPLPLDALEGLELPVDVF